MVEINNSEQPGFEGGDGTLRVRWEVLVVSTFNFYRTQINQKANNNHSGGFNYFKSCCLEKKTRESIRMAYKTATLGSRKLFMAGKSFTNPDSGTIWHCTNALKEVSKN